MKPRTKKFIKWLIIADVLFIVAIITIGVIFIKDHHNQRFYILGQGTGQFIFFSNLAAVLIYFFYNKRKAKTERNSSSLPKSESS